MTDFGKDLIQSMSEALAHAKGDADTGVIEHVIDVKDVDPKAIRSRLSLTQAQMALFLGTSLSGYRKWEQGQRSPRGAAKTLLHVMDKEPAAVLRALAPAEVA